MSLVRGIIDTLGIRRRTNTDSNEHALQQNQAQLNPYEMVDADSLVQHVQNEFKRRESERLPYELQWRLNIAFIEGNQYLDINPVAQTLEEIPKYYWWQEREVFNHIAPNIETRIARLTKMRPILKARPGSNERDDLRRTKITSQLLKTIYYDQKVQDKIADIIPWLEAVGTVLVKNFWDPNAGPFLEIDEINENGRGKRIIREGDLGILICPAPEIYPDSSLHQEIEDCKSIIHAKIYHIDDIKEIWGVEVAPETSAVLRLAQSITGQGGMGINSGYQYTTQYVSDCALVKEYWEVPTKKWPQGRLIIIANGKLLHFGPNPYRVGRDGTIALPFSKVVCIKRPGCFWGKTVTERLIPIQRRYNALRNRKAEFLNSCSIGGWLVEEGSVDIDEWEKNAGSPGFIGQFKPGSTPPKQIENGNLPPQFEYEEQTLLQEFSILSGVSEISRQSKAPPGVKSGVAMSLALEQDETRLSATAQNIEEFLVECASQWLRIYKQFVSGYRVLKAVGKNNIVDVYTWTGSDLKADDVIIEPISALSESPAQRRQMVFDLATSGLFIDPDTGRFDKAARTKLLETLEMGDWEDIDSSEELHISKAERENRMMSELNFALPAPYDDHELHIRMHNEYRLTVEFESIAQQIPQIQELFDYHVGIHASYFRSMLTPMVEGEGKSNNAE